MALVSCSECGKPLTNDDALLRSCVNCGHVFTPEQRDNNRKLVLENLKAKAAEKKREKQEPCFTTLYATPPAPSARAVTSAPRVIWFIAIPLSMIVALVYGVLEFAGLADTNSRM
jgi:hypothetical protein